MSLLPSMFTSLGSLLAMLMQRPNRRGLELWSLNLGGEAGLPHLPVHLPSISFRTGHVKTLRHCFQRRRFEGMKELKSNGIVQR